MRSKKPLTLSTVLTAGLLTAGVLATAAPGQSTHDHAAMMVQEGGIPTEPGQGAFAAIAEIVAMLAADPETDWGKVDIDALRQHLIDMDNLVTFAEVTQDNRPDGAVFHADLTGPGGDAVARMVPAHAPVLAAETGWASTTETVGDTIVWTVTSAENAAEIHGLGFFGLMAVGNHHPAHHLGIATGAMVH